MHRFGQLLQTLISNKSQKKDMDPLAGDLVAEIAAHAADAVDLEEIEKKWWWKPLTKFFMIAPFIALGIYYFS